MTHKLQIIIPHYNESQEIVANLLNSIKMQQAINFADLEVLIINDGNEVILKDSFIKDYPFSIQYFIKDWEGPAAARQYGLEKATADYVMFCDSDDMFYRLDALWEVFKIIEAKSPDVITSQFITDYESPTFSTFSPINHDDIWIHGKIWKLDYLKEKTISWDTSLKICEDSLFTRLGLNLTKNIINIPNTLYYWRQREDSYSQKLNGHALETYLDRIASCESLVKKFLSLKETKLAARFIFLQIYECYFELQCREWFFPENIGLKLKIESKIADFMRLYDYLLSDLQYQEAAELINMLRDRYYIQTGVVSLEEISFVEWKKMLIENYINKEV